MYDPYDEPKWPGFLIAFCIIISLFFMFKGCINEQNAEYAKEDAWCQQHNTTRQELEIFARIMNVEPSAVIASAGLQKEFERFENGDLRQVGQEQHREGKHTVTKNVFQ